MRIFNFLVVLGCVGVGCSSVEPAGVESETTAGSLPASGTGGVATDPESPEGTTSDESQPTTAQGESTFMQTGMSEGTGTASTGTSGTSGTGTSGDPDVTTGGGTSTGGTGDGCGADAGAEGAQDRMIEVAGAERHYIVVIPPGYDPATPHPVVFAWHGLGGSGTLARAYFKIEEAAAGAAIFVYPDGLPQANMQGQSGWNLADGGEDVQFFDAMLADVTATACVDAGRVFSAGHSFGGYMTNSLGCYRGGTIRAIAPVAGGGPFGACTGQVAAWLAHGTLDAVVPFAMGEASRDAWTAANGCGDQADPTPPAPCTAFAGCDAGFPVHWCAHDEPDFSGHAWPAWAGAGIWGFFAGL